MYLARISRSLTIPNDVHREQTAWVPDPHGVPHPLFDEPVRLASRLFPVLGLAVQQATFDSWDNDDDVYQIYDVDIAYRPEARFTILDALLDRQEFLEQWSPHLALLDRSHTRQSDDLTTPVTSIGDVLATRQCPFDEFLDLPPERLPFFACTILDRLPDGTPVFDDRPLADIGADARVHDFDLWELT